MRPPVRGPDPWGYNPPTTNAANFFLPFISSGVLGGALVMPKQNKTEWYYLVSTHFGTIAAHKPFIEEPPNTHILPTNSWRCLV